MTITKPQQSTTKDNLWDVLYALHWRHNERDGASNHQRHACVLDRFFRRRSKKTSKPRVTGLCEGNSPVTGEFPAQSASNAGNVSIWWRHHVYTHERTTDRTCTPTGKLVLRISYMTNVILTYWIDTSAILSPGINNTTDVDYSLFQTLYIL